MSPVQAIDLKVNLPGSSLSGSRLDFSFSFPLIFVDNPPGDHVGEGQKQVGVPVSFCKMNVHTLSQL